MWYLLAADGRTPIPTRDILAVQDQDEKGLRRIALTEFPDGVEISTVFLALDHRYDQRNGGSPLLWETMIFGGEHDGYQQRYSTYESTANGHITAVKLVSPMVHPYQNGYGFWRNYTDSYVCWCSFSVSPDIATFRYFDSPPANFTYRDFTDPELRAMCISCLEDTGRIPFLADMIEEKHSDLTYLANLLRNS